MSVSTQERNIADSDYFLPIVVHLRPAVNLSDDQLFEFCQVNQELQIERNADGDLIILPLTGGETSIRNSEISMQLGIWAKRDGTGKAFGSSTGFWLPNGAMRSPDAAWLPLSKWNALTPKQRKKFAPLCPYFVVELRSPTDRLKTLQAKMREYRENGAKLGLLIDPEEKRVHVYRRGRKTQTLEDPKAVSCDPLLPGFVLDLREIWQDTGGTRRP